MLGLVQNILVDPSFFSVLTSLLYRVSTATVNGANDVANLIYTSSGRHIQSPYVYDRSFTQVINSSERLTCVVSN